MQIPLFCSRCSSQLEYSEKSQRARCPRCTSPKTQSAKASVAKANAKIPLTPEQRAIKRAARGPRRTERFRGGHGILKPEEIPEKVIQQRIMEHFYSAGWLVVRLNSGSMKTKTGGYLRAYRIFGMPEQWASSGLPDLIAFRGSRVLLIEVKDRLGQLRDSQVRFIEFAQRFNIKVHIMRDWQSAAQMTQEMITREANRPTRAEWLHLKLIEFIARRELGVRLDELVNQEMRKVEAEKTVVENKVMENKEA